VDNPVDKLWIIVENPGISVEKLLTIALRGLHLVFFSEETAVEATE